MKGSRGNAFRCADSNLLVKVKTLSWHCAHRQSPSDAID